MSHELFLAYIKSLCDDPPFQKMCIAILGHKCWSGHIKKLYILFQIGGKWGNSLRFCVISGIWRRLVRNG